jgi:hypothetical protein
VDPAPQLLVGRHPARYDANAAAVAGMASGLLAGIAMAIVFVAVGAIRHIPPSIWPRLVAASFRRHNSPILVGIAGHLGLSLAFGLAFGLVTYCWQRATVLWAGALYGVLVYAFMLLEALPVVNPRLVLVARGLSAALANLGFGLLTGALFEILRFRASPFPGRRGATLTIQPHQPGA